MADAADPRHEQHARGHDGRQHLRVVAGAAGHANGPSAGKRPCSRLRWRPGSRRSSSRARRCESLHGDGAGAFALASSAMVRSNSSSRAITAGSSSRIWNSISAPPGMMLGAPGSSVMRPVVQTVRGPQAIGETLVDCDAELCQRQPGIFPCSHAGGAGMILLTDEIDLVLPDADDGGDDADREAPLSSVSPCSIWASRYPICRPGSAAMRGRPRGPCRRARRAWCGRWCGRRRHRCRPRSAADIGPAAEEAAEMAFLVAPGGDFDGAFGGGSDRSRAPPRAHRRRRADHRASRRSSGFRDAARQQFRSCLRACAEHVADAVDRAGEARVGQICTSQSSELLCGSERSACVRRSCRRRWHGAH